METVFRKLDRNAKNFLWADGLIIAFAFYIFYSQFGDAMDVNAASSFRPDGVLDTTLPGIATVVLFISNMFNNMVVRTAESDGSLTKLKNQFLVTMILGLVFIGIIAYEIGYYAGINFGPEFSLFSNSYHMMVRLFYGHIAFGIITHFVSYVRLEADEKPSGNANLIAFTTKFWNFLTYLWLVLFVTLYLL